MPDAVVSVPNSGAAPIDVSQQTRTDGTTVDRQRVAIGDPTDTAQLAPVDSQKGLSVNVTNADLLAVLKQILQYQTATFWLMSQATGIKVDPAQYGS